MNGNSLFVSFKDKDFEISMNDIKELRFSNTLKSIVFSLGFHKLIILDQIHSSYGININNTLVLSKDISMFEQQGDYLITNIKNLALIVLTADCVPVVLYDQKQNVVGLVHAGWKGSATNIIEKVLQVMNIHYGTIIQDIIVSFGPSARKCCYEVSEKFIDEFTWFKRSLKAFDKRNDRWYFDNVIFLQEQLIDFGLDEQNINKTNALCTICNNNFCSFRREKENAGRQVTIVALR